MDLAPGPFSAHERWMRLALDEARASGEAGDVPVGAVVVVQDRVIGRGRNQVEVLKDPTAHAEIIALGAAAAALGDWRLDECTLYTTLEPCTMCAGAVLLGRPRRIVYGAADPRAGALVSTARLLESNPYRLDFEVLGGVLEAECADLLRDFFRRLRVRSDAEA